MLGVSEVAGLKEEEIELDLGLCIGVSFRKPEKSKLINGFGVVDQIASEKETQTASLRTNTSPPSLSSPIASSEPENALLDPHTKREIQALRRQEAKRKREEKRSRGGRNEPQIEEQQPAIKKERLVDANVMNVNGNLNLSNGQTNPRYPVQPGQYPYPTPVQFVPYTNGFAYPCVVPCWAPTGGGGFRPFQAHQDLGKNGGDKDTDQNGGVLGKPASLQASPICSSSTVSEHQSAGSHEGGSSETRSHSSQGFPEQNHLSNGSNSTPKDTSNSFDCNSQDKVAPQKEEPKSGNAEPVSNSNPNPISHPEDSPPPPPPLKEITKMEPIVANPPKPQTPIRQNSNTNALSLPQMPYVSTTGNGPNGKTIHGFLYRYSTKSEISIVCVCHGSTFSPAEFVHHAGGTDVSQPLRHITVIPSAFG